MHTWSDASTCVSSVKNAKDAFSEKINLFTLWKINNILILYTWRESYLIKLAYIFAFAFFLKFRIY